MVRRLVVLCTAACVIALASSSAWASVGFFGTQLQGNGESPLGHAVFQYLVTVDNGIEFQNGVNGLWNGSNIDVSDTQILIDFTENNAFGWYNDFNGYVFRDTLDNIPSIVGVALDPSSTVTPRDLWSDADAVYVDMYGRSFGPSDFVLLNVQFVPEPTAILIWSLLGGLAIAFRWRRRNPAV
jgi:hypothetical protein